MRLEIKEVNVAQRGAVPLQSKLFRLYLWACERLYDELAWWYDIVSWIVSAGQWRNWQMEVWREVRGQHVLELGCGTGAMLVVGARRGLNMVGVDRSPRMLAVAAQRVALTQSNCQILLGDGGALPLQDGGFDTVMATFPAVYILAPRTLAEMRRVLNERGRLVILGLWVELHLGVIGRWLPIFYGRPSTLALNAVVQRVNHVGFRARWVEQRKGLFTVGVLVAEQESLKA
jgi:SAM-dependent methyltransferase